MFQIIKIFRLRQEFLDDWSPFSSVPELFIYDHDDYYSKECLWYDEIKLNDDTKKWLLESSPPEIVSEDLSKVSRNNDIYREVCKEHKSMMDKMKDKADRVIDKTLMATEE